MRDSLVTAFASRFGRSPEGVAQAPGRVNLIGEHTDYNQGLVLPCAIDRATFVAAALRMDGRFQVVALDLGEAGEFQGDALEHRGGWIDYVQGVVSALREAGVELSGCDLAIQSRVPRESGLSSSAALTVGIVTVLDAVLGLDLDARRRAEVAHRAESGFVGVACGIMDPFASALGRRGHALRIDCRSQAVEPVPLPGERLGLLLVESGVKRALSAGPYADRRADCAAAFSAARDAGVAPPGARSLRDLDPECLPALAGAMAPVHFRRARHVITENERVDAVCRALGRNDLTEVGALLREGMRSLRDDFAVSTPELDYLCTRGDQHAAVFGSRLTGAGFGGCTLHLVEAGAEADVGAWISGGFEARFGRRPVVHEVVTADGAGIAGT